MGINPAALGALLRGDVDNFLTASTPGGIEAQEAQGQRDLVNSSRLPHEFIGGMQSDLELAGVVFGDVVDDLFRNVTLPEGWKLEATEHSMWSDLLDNHGRKRAAVFYKAAFYDRKAHLSVTQRFNISSYNHCDAEGNLVEYGQPYTHLATVITDCEKPVKLIGCYVDSSDNWSMRDVHYEEATKWLDANYPDWKDRSAYWD
jgi:hypothetical protein